MTKTVVNCLFIALAVNVAGAQERISVEFNADQVAPNVILIPQPVISGELTVIEQPVVIPVPAVVQPIPGGTRPEPSGRKGSKGRMVPTLPKEFATLDKNGDGQIGMYEWERSKYAEFIKLDKNGDGFLTAQELGAKGLSLGGRGRGSVSEKDALPNPGNLSAYAQKVGETFAFSVTGRVGGSVYGTGTYTTDSDLAAAAVHAGVLKDGEKGVVQVTIVEPPNQFSGTTANGITSNSWQAYPGAYTVR